MKRISAYAFFMCVCQEILRYSDASESRLTRSRKYSLNFLVMLIGADELILHIRKNKKRDNESNDVIGKEIRKIVESLGGHLTKKRRPAKWDTSNTKKVGKDKLPKTAAQYEIDFDKLPDLFKALSL